ncbi:MAG: hypothetical protein HC915_13900 [Anaerolineae bacterium]|nr:hypothetical protein [Anaerolineae bacterium]
MSFNLVDLEAQQTRHADLIRAAEQHANHQANRAERTAHFYDPLLARVGDALIALGTDLKARYGELEALMEQNADAPPTEGQPPAVSLG